MQFTAEDLQGMEKRRRAALVNSISGYKPANLVGTVNGAGQTNLAIMSSAVHLGSHPPLLALVVRPGGEDRHTLHNLLELGHYTLNHLNPDIVEAGHQTAARYSQAQSEFAATGLTPHWVEGFPAPFVREASVRLGLQLREHQELTINRTHLVIGEVILAELPDGSLHEDGSLDLQRTRTVALSGLDTYCSTRPLKRMAYAKPDLPPRQV